MPLSAQRIDAKTQRYDATELLKKLSWDDIRYFVSCADHESFRKASDHLGVSSSTVVRRISSLEGTINLRLFDRLPEGVSLTQAGLALIDHARKMEQAAFGIARTTINADKSNQYAATIAVTEGLGAYWIMPQLVVFRRNNPQTMVNLFCSMNNADVLRMEADIAIQYMRPTNPELIAVKLGRMHLYSFASQRYLDTYGVPKQARDLLDHQLVEQSASTIDSGALDVFFGLVNTADLVGIRTNTSTAHLYAIEQGGGIGLLPSYAYALGADAVPLDLGGPYDLDIWLTYHRDLNKTDRNMRIVKWLRSLFDPAVFPWFAEEFIHPRELARLVPEKAQINIGTGYLAVNPQRSKAARPARK